MTDFVLANSGSSLFAKAPVLRFPVFEGLRIISYGYLCLTKTILVLTDKFNNFSKSNFFLHMHVSLCILMCNGLDKQNMSI